MNNEIYLDNSATTALCTEAKAAMLAVMNDVYGNPSSLHTVGLTAEKVLRDARENVLASLGARGDARQLIFCGSGSEANNLALIGTYTAKKRRAGARVIITAGEHSSTEASAAYLETLGADVVRLSTKNGAIDMDELRTALTPETVLLSAMLVNNETGALYPIGDMFQTAKALCPNILCHCDAVQGYTKVKCTARSLGADLVTVSAHKIHGPKGIAALYATPEVLNRRALVPIIHGGQQENGLRAGTENTVCIAGFGAAAKVAMRQQSEILAQLESVSRHLSERLSTDPRLAELRINRPQAAVWHILNITLPNIKSETMLHYLSGKGIFVSSGSACSSHTKTVSRALSAFGLSDKEADCSLRISLSRYNTNEDADKLCDALAEGLSALIRIR